MSDIPVEYPLGGYYTSAEVDALLAAKAALSHTHDDRYYTESEVDSFLSGKADSVHTHDDRYYTETEIDTQMSGKSDSSHIHDGRYYTETEIDTQMSGKANSVHTHDDRYYTETEVDSLLAAKAASSHSHNEFVPIGGIIFYDSGITNASYPGASFSKCEGGALPDLRGKFLLPDATPGGTGGSSTHSHTPSFTGYNVTPCGGGGNTVAGVDITLSTEDHTPPYHKLITLARTA